MFVTMPFHVRVHVSFSIKRYAADWTFVPIRPVCQFMLSQLDSLVKRLRTLIARIRSEVIVMIHMLSQVKSETKCKRI